MAEIADVQAVIIPYCHLGACAREKGRALSWLVDGCFLSVLTCPRGRLSSSDKATSVIRLGSYPSDLI